MLDLYWLSIVDIPQLNIKKDQIMFHFHTRNFPFHDFAKSYQAICLSYG